MADVALNETAVVTCAVLKAGWPILEREDADERSLAELVRDIGEALRDDDRVHDLRMPELDPEWDHEPQYFPSATGQSPADLYGAQETVRGLYLSNPFEFVIKSHGPEEAIDEDGFAPDEYHVRWDGLMVVVLWNQPVDELVDDQAGVSLVHVLWDAAHTVAAHLRLLHCSRDCSYEFCHQNVRLLAKSHPDDPDGWMPTPKNELTLEGFVDDPADLELIATNAYLDLTTPMWSFLDTKEHSNRLMNIEEAVRNDALTLLSAAFRPKGKRSWRHPRGGRKNILGRREKLRLLDRTWWGLAALEGARMEWRQQILEFDHLVDANEKALLAADLRERSLIEEQELSRIERALEQVGTRMDTRRMVGATGVGGLAGAAAGAATGFLG